MFADAVAPRYFLHDTIHVAKKCERTKYLYVVIVSADTRGVIGKQ